MATAESVKAKIQGLIERANEATGKEDTDLTGAVGSLIAGFGQGGGSDVLDALIAGTLTDLEWQGTTIRERAFMSLTSLQSVSLANVTRIDNYAFYYCYNLYSVSVPKVADVGNSAFFLCKTLTEIELPSVKSFGISVFEKCVALTKVDVGSGVADITAAAFRGCSALNTLILRSTTMVSLANVSAFDSSPFASGGTGGTVYVPAALISEYQQATNWSTLYAAGTCNFVAIEGSEYE